MFYFLQFIEVFFQVVGILILLSGGVTAAVEYLSLQPWNSSHVSLKRVEFVRLGFGQKIVFGLEFFVLADALATVADPTLEDLSLLGMIVLIRTALSFFISRELIAVKKEKIIMDRV